MVVDDAELVRSRYEALIVPAEYLAPEDCQEGFIYYGRGRSIGQIAVCTGEIDAGLGKGSLGFTGLRNKFGVDYLCTEVHYDQDSMFGTFLPFVELERIPEGMDEKQTMHWLLDQTIELLEAKSSWLRSMPERFRDPAYWPIDLELVEEALEGSRELQRTGFSDTPAPTFREIMEAKRVAAEATVTPSP